ncbi:Six-hairpin glycosidase, partial [Cantharellus anzutake]|uniref:Six-hairpin glycosidase n=1 Tax=Cantharellus anzutake TaxID=1750568 RepID=UPI001908738E
IGNLRTAAMVSVEGIVESYCIPHFDSPSVFARMLDSKKGGHFSVHPTIKTNPRQGYVPSTNVLCRFLSDQGVANVIDFLPLQAHFSPNKPLLHWFIRRVEVTRGRVPLRLEVAPAFNYARDPHQTSIVHDDSSTNQQNKAIFISENMTLDLRFVAEGGADSGADQFPPSIDFGFLDLRHQGHLGLSVYAEFELAEGQAVTFILRTPPTKSNRSPQLTEDQAVQAGIPYDILLRGAAKMRPRDDPLINKELMAILLKETKAYWRGWIGKSTYKGSWREAVHRSALALKLLIFEPTGAIVASPTFSLPEYIGGTRNCTSRFSWIRDSSFTLYALIRLGFTEEASAFTEFIFDRLQHKNDDGSLQIIQLHVTGGKDLEEIELTHLDGHKGSKPVRIGNGAADHVQLDIYGELMDCIYLGQKFGKPLGYDRWVQVRDLCVHSVVHHEFLFTHAKITLIRTHCRSHLQYSKVMLWVAIDRGIRLAEKRSLPCPNRDVWYKTRDSLYEEIMQRAWNSEKGFFSQSYEDRDVLDSAMLVMPLVFFCSASEPRFLSTLQAIMRSPERGGLSANNLVYRYDATAVDDGVGGEEGAFSLCTLWAVEALSRAGDLDKAVEIFESFIDYGNHVGLFTEEISPAGEGLGNAVQGFTHVTLISAAYNLSRTLGHLG